MTINVKVNSLNTSIFGTTPVKDGLSVVPSYLMKTPSTDFAIEKDRTSNTGIFALASTNTYDSDTHTSTITLTALEGYFQSTIGKHYLKIRENAILDLVGFEDGEYILSLELVFIDGGDTELNFHINLSSDPIIGEKLAGLSIVSWEISTFQLVDIVSFEKSFRDKISVYSKEEINNNSRVLILPNEITENIDIPTGKNGILSLPLEIATGVEINVASGSSLTIVK